MKIKFQDRRTGETFITKNFVSIDEAWDYYWKLRANKNHCKFETIGF